jgi:hypothetical protein
MSAAPRYRLNKGVCGTIFNIGGVKYQLDASGNPVLLNPNNTVPYLKCPTLTNPTAGMATSTNNTNISKKMRYAQMIRTATDAKNGKQYYAMNKVNAYGSWQGAPGGYGQALKNVF